MIEVFKDKFSLLTDFIDIWSNLHLKIRRWHSNRYACVHSCKQAVLDQPSFLLGSLSSLVQPLGVLCF